MKRAALGLAIALALSAAAAQAQGTSAQAVWRCGPAGSIYTDTPCPDDGRIVDVADVRSAEQVQAARAVAQRDHRLADAWRRERLQREARAATAPGAIRSARQSHKSPTHVRRCAVLGRLATAAPSSARRCGAAGDTFRAVAPSSRLAKG